MKMLSKGLFILYLLISALLTSCNDGEKSSWNKTENKKIEYKVIKTSNSEKNASKIEYGDDLLLHVKLTKEDGTELLNSFKTKNPLKITLPTKMHRNLFEEILTFAKMGDSIIAKVRYVDANRELAAYKSFFKNKNEKVLLSYKILDVYSLKQKNEDKEIQYAFENAFGSVESYRKEKDLVIREDSTHRVLLLDAIKKNKKALLSYDLNIQGIKYNLIDSGSGENFKKGDKIYFYYMAALHKDEIIFDDIFIKGSRTKVEIGKKDKSSKLLGNLLSNLKMGSKALIFVPFNKAYGAVGSPPIVPPYSDLMFYIEVVAVK